MSPLSSNPAADDPNVDAPAPISDTPDWYPDWAKEMAELYFSGSTCFFVFHGNVNDLVRRSNAAGEDEFVSLPELAFSNIRKGSYDWVPMEYRKAIAR